MPLLQQARPTQDRAQIHYHAQAGLPVSKTNLAAMFIKMVRRNLHVVMCMSPLGDEYRDRIRQFPSLINCCTIDWFSPWPDEALSAVARTLMAREAEAMDPKDFTGIVSMCTLMHGSVCDACTEYFVTCPCTTWTVHAHT